MARPVSSFNGSYHKVRTVAPSLLHYSSYLSIPDHVISDRCKPAQKLCGTKEAKGRHRHTPFLVPKYKQVLADNMDLDLRLLIRSPSRMNRDGFCDGGKA